MRDVDRFLGIRLALEQAIQTSNIELCNDGTTQPNFTQLGFVPSGGIGYEFFPNTLDRVILAVQVALANMHRPITCCCYHVFDNEDIPGCMCLQIWVSVQ